MRKFPVIHTPVVLCVLLCIGSAGALAQPRPSPSAVRQRVEALQARTTPGYINKMYGTKSRVPSPGMSSLRIRAGCGNSYLCSLSALPVRLISFEGKRTEHGLVELSWETSAELHSLGFEIERSVSNPAHFEKRGFVGGKGDTERVHNYTFQDANAFGEVTYYRLRQLDTDGRFEYSRIIAIEGLGSSLSLTAAPNPVGSTLSLSLNAVTAGDLDVRLLNMLGQTMVRQTFGLSAGSDNALFMQVGHLSSGVYLLHYCLEGTSGVLRVVKE